MRSYASVDRIVGRFAVCEVELLAVEESNTGNFWEYDTVGIDIPLQEISENLGEVNEGDILVVEHDGENVSSVYYKDEAEKAKRLEVLKEIRG